MLDRALQKTILEELAANYPERNYELMQCEDEEEKRRIANIRYLEEHGLVESGLDQGMDGHYSFSGARITASGMDFLQDDGGLTAILRTVTVKLHEDTIRELLKARIESTALAPSEKSKLRKQIDELRSEALKTATKKLVEKGIECLPDVASWIQTLVP